MYYVLRHLPLYLLSAWTLNVERWMWTLNAERELVSCFRWWSSGGRRIWRCRSSASARSAACSRHGSARTRKTCARCTRSTAAAASASSCSPSASTARSPLPGAHRHCAVCALSFFRALSLKPCRASVNLRACDLAVPAKRVKPTSFTQTLTIAL